jgi:hypothetical protein
MNSTPRAVRSSKSAWMSSVLKIIDPAPLVRPAETAASSSAVFSSSNIGGPGRLRIRLTSGCPGGPTVSQR